VCVLPGRAVPFPLCVGLRADLRLLSATGGTLYVSAYAREINIPMIACSSTP
jgi:hypothetical protein